MEERILNRLNYNLNYLLTSFLPQHLNDTKQAKVIHKAFIHTQSITHIKHELEQHKSRPQYSIQSNTQSQISLVRNAEEEEEKEEEEISLANHSYYTHPSKFKHQTDRHGSIPPLSHTPLSVLRHITKNDEVKYGLQCISIFNASSQQLPPGVCVEPLTINGL